MLLTAAVFDMTSFTFKFSKQLACCGCHHSCPQILQCVNGMACGRSKVMFLYIGVENICNGTKLNRLVCTIHINFFKVFIFKRYHTLLRLLKLSMI